MDISGATTTQVIRSQAPLGRALQPLAEIRDELPARQDRERASRQQLRGSGELVEHLRRSVVVEPDLPRTEDFTSHRAHQAVYAYTALQRSEERDYVSRVLGVDEYA